jgi:hypothetical protein
MNIRTSHTLWGCALVALCMQSAAAQDKVPLKLDLPRPLFVGTPRPLQIPNLEPPRQGPRPPFLVPPGTVLLSKGRPVTSSDPLPVIGELSFVTDGKKTGTDGTFVELGPGVQWVQIDLGAVAQLNAIVVWHFHAQARVYHDVVVRVADDAGFTKNVRTLFDNDHDNSSKLGAGPDPAYVETNEGRIIDGKGVAARYVRLYSNGNTTDELNHYVEVEVYGQPAGARNAGAATKS